MDIMVYFSNNNSHTRRIESAVALINGCQNYYHLHSALDTRLSCSGVKINAKKKTCDQFEAECTMPHCILVSEDLFDDNWFSHEYRSSAIITIGDWEANFAPPSLKSYLMYQMAQALIHFSADMSEQMALNIVHDPPVGCLYDMAINKPDIKLGMVAGNLCPHYVSQLRSLWNQSARY